jgi:hypothetical protein
MNWEDRMFRAQSHMLSSVPINRHSTGQLRLINASTHCGNIIGKASLHWLVYENHI